MRRCSGCCSIGCYAASALFESAVATGNVAANAGSVGAGVACSVACIVDVLLLHSLMHLHKLLKHYQSVNKIVVSVISLLL